MLLLLRWGYNHGVEKRNWGAVMKLRCTISRQKSWPVINPDQIEFVGLGHKDTIGPIGCVSTRGRLQINNGYRFSDAAKFNNKKVWKMEWNQVTKLVVRLDFGADLMVVMGV